MAPSDLSRLRNFALVGHRSAGKTLLAEAMLATSGVIGRMGSIDVGSTVSDYHEDEKARQISIHSSLLTTEWLDTKFNYIDTPGYLDFISEALGALRVVDFALIVIDAADGVQVGTEQVWQYATQYNIPKFIVLNGLDKENVDFETALAGIREHFGERVFPMNVPVNAGPGFNKLLDVMRSELITYKLDAHGEFEESAADGDDKTRVKELHRELIEFVAESDESLLEKFFEQDGLSEDEMRAGLHHAVQEENFTPLFCTSALHNVGVARLMDFLAKYGSSPVDRETVTAHDGDDNEVEVSLSDSDPVLFVFKTISEQHVGDLSFFRVYSGTIHTGDEIYNATRGTMQKIGQMFFLNGKERNLTKTVSSGDIGAVVKMRDTHTGDTLCAKGKSLTLPKVDFPRPNIHSSLNLTNKGDEERLSGGLSTLHEEDPTFIYRVDDETGETVISGQGELHLQVISQALQQRFRVNVELRKPKIRYRETIKKKADAKYRHKKQSGGAGQFAEVWMRIEPLPRDTGVDFGHSLVGQNVDRVFVPSVEKGVMKACTTGILAKCRVVDVKIDFYDGKQHPVDSKDVAFQIAGEAAFREAFLNAKPVLLEPILKITVKIPDENLGDVMGDISAKGGRILGIDAEGKFQIVNALVPERELYHYSTTVRSLTGGRGLYMEEFDHYEEMPQSLAQPIIDASKGDHDED